MKFYRKPPSDPVRLTVQDADLKRNLALLANEEAPSTAELRRMRERLTVVFESPAPRHGPLLRLARGPLGKVLLGVMVLGAAVGVSRVGRPRAAVMETETETPITALQSHATDVPGRDVPKPPPASAAPMPPIELPLSETPKAVPRLLGSAAKPHRVRARVPAAPPAQPRESAALGGTLPQPSAAVATNVSAAPASRMDIAAPSAGPAAPASPLAIAAPSAGPAARASIAASGASPAAEPARAQAATTNARPAIPQAPARAVSPQLDEAALLQRARQLASADPEAALRLLNEHQRRFAHGLLSPEREVFTIELLRSLSRSEEATRRLQSFRQNFPGSVYLKRLEH